MSRMDCSEVSDLLIAYHDDELGDTERSAVAGHVSGCSACTAKLKALEAQSARIRASGSFALPAGLEASVRNRLGVVDTSDTRLRRRAWLAASHLAAACVGALLLYGVISRHDSVNATARDAMTAYARALMSNQSIQVASNEQHTVRPWFTTKVPFSPPVRDVLPGEFPLLGGRVDHLGGRPAAVAVYGRRKHHVDVFAQPRDATTIASTAEWTRNGYSIATWQAGDFAYLAISDLNDAELRQLTRALREPSP